MLFGGKDDGGNGIDVDNDDDDNDDGSNVHFRSLVAVTSPAWRVGAQRAVSPSVLSTPSSTRGVCRWVF